jgi:hypothetical protein
MAGSFAGEETLRELLLQISVIIGRREVTFDTQTYANFFQLVTCSLAGRIQNGDWRESPKARSRPGLSAAQLEFEA